MKEYVVSLVLYMMRMTLMHNAYACIPNKGKTIFAWG